MSDKALDSYPKLTVLSCPASVSKKLAVIAGTLEDAPDRECRLFAAGKEIPVKDGKWLVSVPLNDGVNHVAITAANNTGKNALTSCGIFCGPLPPQITVDICEPGEKPGTYKLVGKVTDARHAISSVKLNGAPVRHSGDLWAEVLPVKPGFNAFEITAQNSIGKSATFAGSVYAKAAAPLITLTDCPVSVKAAAVTVSGTVADPFAETPPSVFVNDYPAKLVNGAFKMKLNVTQGINPVTVIAKSATGKASTLTAEIECTLAVPVLKILNCPKTVSGPKLRIMGLARGEFANTGRPVTVYVNGEEAELTDGKWTIEAALVPGENKLIFAAVNDEGVRTEDTRTVRRE